MKNQGLALTIIFQAESANYGEGLGNMAVLKKVSRFNGEQYTYISRQALRYNIVEQFDEELATVKRQGSGNKSVIQFAPEATIADYPELDFFGYLKTETETSGKKRSAKVRLSHAISLETYKGDTEFITNNGLFSRLTNEKDIKEGMNIAQAEVHQSYYKYTLTIDLNEIGEDDTYGISLDNHEKARRVNKLLETIQFLYRDIRGRREDLKPLFIIGGVYDVKNPVFHNAVNMKNQEIILEEILDLFQNERIRTATSSGIVSGRFRNQENVRDELESVGINKFMEDLKSKVSDYYEGS